MGADRKGVGVITTAVDGEAVTVVVAGIASGISITLSVVSLLGTRINSPGDTWDMGVMGSDSIHGSVPGRQ